MSARASKLFWVWLLALVTSVVVLDRVSVAYPPWNGTGQQNTWTGASAAPVLNPNWSQASWFIDPQSAVGTCSDGNAGTTSNAPLCTWHALNDQRWGCFGNPSECPRLRQTTTITFNSSQTTNADPVYFRPAVENGSSVVLQGGAPTVVASGVTNLAIVAKNRTAGSNSLLQATLGASGAVGQLVENTTHSSRAWAYKSLGANAFAMTQPMVKTTAPGTSFPAEVDTWASTDSVNLLSPISVNIVDFHPILADASANNRAYIYQLKGLDPAGTGANLGYLGDVRVYESFLQRLTGCDAVVGPVAATVFTNDFIAGGVEDLASSVSMFGGAIASTSTNAILSGGISASVTIDGDFIVGAPMLLGGAQIGFMYLDAGVTLQSGTLTSVTIAYGGHVLYGGTGNNISLVGESHLFLNGGTFTSAFTAPSLVTGISINGSTSACSSSNANNPDVINCAITTTPAHLDAAQGTAGFGGTAFAFAGSSVSTSN